MNDVELVIGVTGGIAAYKTASLVSRLVQDGAHVTVAMTEAATRFVGPATIAALTGSELPEHIKIDGIDISGLLTDLGGIEAEVWESAVGSRAIVDVSVLRAVVQEVRFGCSGEPGLNSPRCGICLTPHEEHIDIVSP